MKARNVTLALPEDLLRRLKVIAAKQDSSLSGILILALQQIADLEDGYEEARQGMLHDLRKGYNLGTRGKITWTRESLHER